MMLVFVGWVRRCDVECGIEFYFGKVVGID